MTSAHNFIDISQNILNLWIRLIFPETRHLRLQFCAQERDNSNQNWVRYDFSKLALQVITAAMGKPNFDLLFTPHQSLHLMHQIFPKAKMRSRFMILCQPSLNSLPFIFSPPLLYKPPSPSFQSTQKTSFLLLSWVLVKLSSLVISWSSWDSRYWVRLTLPFLALFFLRP